MERKTVYFEKREPENTDVTFRLVQERLGGLEIKKLVLASTTGATAKKASEFFKDSGIKLIVVPHQYGYRNRKVNLFPPELVKSLRHLGHEVHFDRLRTRTGSTTRKPLLRLKTLATCMVGRSSEG